MMCLSMFWLIQLSMAAIVVLLPEPVAPQNSRIPSLAFASLSSGSASSLRSSKLGTRLLTCRKTTLTSPRWWKALTRKRPIPSAA